MNKRRIAILLALMLALSGACLADEEAPAEQQVEAQQAAPEAKAEPKAAKEEKAEKPKEAEAAPALIAEVETGAAEIEASPAQEEPRDSGANSEPAAQAESAPEGDESGEGAGNDEAAGSDAADAAGGEDGPSFDEPDPADADAEGDMEVSSTQSFDEAEPGADGEGDPGDGADSEGDGEPDPDVPDTPDPDNPDPDNPEPGALTISVEGATWVKDDNAWQIPYATPDDEIHFNWTAVEGATYTWSITAADGSKVASDDTQKSETSLTLKAKEYVEGLFTLTVTAQVAAGEDEEEIEEPGDGMKTLTATYVFELKLTNSEEEPGEEKPSGDRPSGGFGGFGGGSRSSGGGASSAGGAAAQGEQGTQVTPGESLTDDHASGSKDMTAYGTVKLSIAKSTQSQLTLGGAELGVALADGESFRAELSGGELILTAEAGEEWRVNGLALEVLARSGVDELTLRCGESGLQLPTALRFGGPVYAACRARGCVAKDFELIASDGGIYVLADGERCALADDGTLVRE